MTVLNGSLTAQTLGILQEVADPATTLLGNDLQPAGQAVDSLFSALVKLRDALFNDDEVALELVGSQITAAHDRLIEARSEMGVRVQQMDFTRNRHEIQKFFFRL